LDETHLVMPSAIILINTDAGAETSLSKKITKIPCVSEVYLVFGVYDIVVKVNVVDMAKLSDIVLRQFRALEGVRSTVTLVVMES